MMSPIKSLYGRRTTAGIINIPSVSGCGFLPNSATSFLLPGKPISLDAPKQPFNCCICSAMCLHVHMVHYKSCASCRVWLAALLPHLRHVLIG